MHREHTASGPELGQIRRCARAELYRSLDKTGCPVSWGVRLFNGTKTQQIVPEPDWTRLALWDRLRADFLGLPADPTDRTGRGFGHS